MAIASFRNHVQSVPVDRAREDALDGARQGDGRERLAVVDAVDHEVVARDRRDVDGERKPVIRDANHRRRDRTRSAGARLRLDAALVGADLDAVGLAVEDEVDVGAGGRESLAQPDAAALADDVGLREVLDGDDLDLDETLSTLYVLDMETKFLCSEDCKGLCARCGADLNLGPCACGKEVDPRLAVLQQLLDSNQ